MIATGIAVGSDGRIDLGPAPTFGIIRMFFWLSGAGELAKLSLLKARSMVSLDMILSTLINSALRQWGLCCDRPHSRAKTSEDIIKRCLCTSNKQLWLEK